MSYRVNDLSPLEPFFHDSYLSSSFETTEIIDSLSSLINYNVKPISQSFPSKLDHPILSILEHYNIVSFTSLLCTCSREEKKSFYPPK
ncbi:MAG: hypothetical protein ACTSYA_09255 [Candidatus Kariarchaeaceae archaeon]